MKKVLKSAMLLLLVFAMAFGVMACGGSGSGDADEALTNVTFPLEQPVTIKMMLTGNESIDFRDQVKNNAVYKRLVEETNVHLEFQFLGDNAAEKLGLLMQSNDYGDVLYGSTILTSGDASKYIAARKFKDLTSFVNADVMPELAKDMAEDPEIRNMITAADGKIYTLPKITGLEGHYLESPIWINKAWLDKLGKKIPTTTDELYNVLKAFKTGDPNGNGIADEIPYIATTSHSYMHTEALLGMYGIATKDGTNDAFVQVVDGKVIFAPAQQGYKDGINFLGKLYKEDLLWKECFTANTNTLNAKLISPTPVVGMFTTNVPVENDYVDDYVCIAPPKAEGYDACWYMHPAIHGSKNQFYVMNTCKYTEVLLKWCDRFYDLEIAITAEYGLPGEGRLNKTEDGKYAFVELDTMTAAKLDEEKPTLLSLIGSSTRSITASDYADKIDWGYNEKTKQHVYSVYKDYITTEPWPRPYYAAEDSYDAAVYTTDMFTQVQKNRAKWVTSGGVSDAEFQAHLDTLNKMGMDKFLSILQKAYDAYKSGSNLA